MVSQNFKKQNESFQKQKDMDGKLFNKRFGRSTKKHHHRHVLSEDGRRISKKGKVIKKG